jgi:hypothetical protein
MRLPTTPKPLIAVEDRLGNVVSVNVIKFSSDASSVLTSQLPGDTNVTEAALSFHDGKGLPGQRGRKFNLWKSVD